MDTYQAIYDAARQALSGCHLSGLQEAIASKFDVSYEVESVKQEFLQVAYEQQRPSVIYRPSLVKFGAKWVASYGGNTERRLPAGWKTGVTGSGETPAEAMADFDIQWSKNEKSSNNHRRVEATDIQGAP